MMRLMIRHHTPLFRRFLLPGESQGGDATDDEIEELYRQLQARIELARIEDSRAWRLLTLAFLRGAHARRPSQWGATTPHERLDCVKRSYRYRLIQTLKRTPPYRAYARRKYADDVENPLLEP